MRGGSRPNSGPKPRAREQPHECLNRELCVVYE